MKAVETWRPRRKEYNCVEHRSLCLLSPFCYKSHSTVDEDEGKNASPVNENAYVPSRGAVNFPVFEFMAKPTFSISTSKIIGVFLLCQNNILSERKSKRATI